MTAKPLRQLIEIATAKTYTKVDFEMQAKANQEIARRFNEWCQTNWRRRNSYADAWLRWLREEGIER